VRGDPARGTATGSVAGANVGVPSSVDWRESMRPPSFPKAPVVSDTLDQHPPHPILANSLSKRSRLPLSMTIFLLCAGFRAFISIAGAVEVEGNADCWVTRDVVGSASAEILFERMMVNCKMPTLLSFNVTCAQEMAYSFL
jgi:hypothetical protein